MHILSLNAWGGRLHERLIPFLAKTDPDMLCLQEVVHTPQSDRDWLDYRDDGMDLPQRANLFAETAAALPGHQAFFCSAARGDLFDGARPVSSQWGLSTHVRTNLPVIGQVQNFIHGDYAPDGFGAHPRARNAHGLRLFDHAAGHPVTIVHLHGLRDPDGKHDTPARQIQAERLVALIRRIWREGERLVVCGDFNLLPGSETFAALAELGLTDLVTSRGHTDTRTSYYEKSPRFADYMLVNEAVTVHDFQVVPEPEVSDHRALLLELG
ncbi:MAG: endonuclease/exonuclease/phosphatase family protein [Pseudomonadota bacterium]|nr:endonuclease/exonuclease/phosphatase family protein [Pseudomonadota bacterium]